MKASELAQHIGRTVEINYTMPWEDWDYTKRGRLNWVRLEKDPNDPRYPILYVDVGLDGAVGFWRDEEVAVRFPDFTTIEKEETP